MSTAVVFVCGPTNLTVYPPFNESVAAAIYGCGMAQQSTSDKNSAPTLRVTPKYKLMLFIIMLYSFVVAAYDVLIDNDDLSVYYRISGISDPELVQVLNLAFANNRVIFENETNTFIEPRLPAGLTHQKYLLMKRELGEEYSTSLSAYEGNLTSPLMANITFKQWSIVDSASNFTTWNPASCCYYCSQSEGECSYQLDYGFKFGWSVSMYYEDNKMTWDVAKKILGGGVSKTYTYYSGSNEIDCPWSQEDGPLQYFYQMGVKTANVINRSCSSSDDCEEWNQVVKIEAPISGKFNIGCYLGFDNVQCASLTANNYCGLGD